MRCAQYVFFDDTVATCVDCQENSVSSVSRICRRINYVAVLWNDFEAAIVATVSFNPGLKVIRYSHVAWFVLFDRGDG